MIDRLRRHRSSWFGSERGRWVVMSCTFVGVSFYILSFGNCIKIEGRLEKRPVRDPNLHTIHHHEQQRRQQQRRNLQIGGFSSIDFDLDLNEINNRSKSRQPQSRQSQTEAPGNKPDGRFIQRQKRSDDNYDTGGENNISPKVVPTPKPPVTPDVIEFNDDDYDVVVLDDMVEWDYTEDEPGPIDNLINRPTFAPTTKAQILNDVDDDDYTAVVIEDDVPWDDVVVKETAKDAFDAIEAVENIEVDVDFDANSNTSNDDFDYETEEPTITPRPSNSFRPTRLASTMPTNEPTTKSSQTPSVQPSSYPSFLPTNHPSMVPSISPTNSCYDDVTYRSPINGLSCSQHHGTNCLSWRFIGLNMTELDELVGACPETCNIDCGSFDLFMASVTFRISRVSGFMGPEVIDDFLMFSINHLESYVRNIGWNVNSDEVSRSNDLLIESSNPDGCCQEDDFFKDDVVDGRPVVFEIEDAELTRQDLVEDPTGRFENSREDHRSELSHNSNDGGAFRKHRALRMRGLNDLQRTKQKPGGESILKTDEALDVNVKFEGFTIGMNPESMSELLVLGIDDVDFTRKLQKSGIDFFSDATVSSAMETEEDDLPFEENFTEEENRSNSTFTVVISYMVPIVVIGFALGSVFYHRCYKKGQTTTYQDRHHQRHTERAQFGGMSATPIAVGIDNSDNSNSNSIIGSSESDGRFFSSNRQTSSVDCGINAKEGDKQSAFSKLISTLNLNLTLTKSKNSTDEDADDTEEIPNPDDGTSRSSSSDEPEAKQRREIPVIGSPLVSPMSDGSEGKESSSENKEAFETFENILPPMIVIDNIDVPDSEAVTPVMSATNASGRGLVKDTSFRSSGSQMEELDTFASEFRKQLLTKSDQAVHSRHHSFTRKLYNGYSNSSTDLRSDQANIFGSNRYVGDEDEDDDQQIIDTVSEDWDGDDLYPPIPSNITAEGDGNNQAGLDDEFDRDQAASKSIWTSSPINLSKKRAYGTWDGNPSSSSDMPDADTDLSTSSIPEALHRSVKPEILPRRRSSLPPKRPPTPERGNNTRKNAGGGNINEKSPVGKNSAFSFTPIARAFVGSGNSTDSGGHRRKSSADTNDDLHLVKNSSSLSALSSDDANTSTKSNNSSNKDNRAARLEFEAPRQGNWGLVLESSSKTGPRIYAVKDYSPLFGLIQKGDKLLEIDGKNVTQSNLTEVTKILKGKSSSYQYHRTSSTSMPIVVSRHPSSNDESRSAEPPVIGSFAYNTSFSSDDHTAYNQDQNSKYGSWGSMGSRVLEDIDEDHYNVINDVDQDQLQQMLFQHHLPYDSDNEI